MLRNSGQTRGERHDGKWSKQKETEQVYSVDKVEAENYLLRPEVILLTTLIIYYLFLENKMYNF